jgi:hypothetical protein
MPSLTETWACLRDADQAASVLHLVMTDHRPPNRYTARSSRDNSQFVLSLVNGLWILDDKKTGHLIGCDCFSFLDSL